MADPKSDKAPVRIELLKFESGPGRSPKTVLKITRPPEPSESTEKPSSNGYNSSLETGTDKLMAALFPNADLEK